MEAAFGGERGLGECSGVYRDGSSSLFISFKILYLIIEF